MRICRSVAAWIGVLSAWLLPSTVWADSITVEHNRSTEPSIVQFILHTEIEASQQVSAFVGVTIKAGATATCAANYSQDIESSGSYKVLSNEESDGKVNSSEDSGVGVVATVPGGWWSLCGWVQPEGNSSTAKTSAVYGPVKLSLGGPMGTTSLSVPSSITAGEALTATVQYSTQELTGEISGTTTASLRVAEAPGSSGCSGPSSRLLNVAGTTQPAAPVVVSQPGTATFSASLPAGIYSVCAYMLQTFPSDNTPGILPQVFGASDATTTVTAAMLPTKAVLPPPQIVVPSSRACAAVQSVGATATVKEAGSSCDVARKVVDKLIRSIGRPSSGRKHAKEAVKVSADGDFVCHVQDFTPSKYKAVCEDGGALVDTSVTFHQTKRRLRRRA